MPGRSEITIHGMNGYTIKHKCPRSCASGSDVALEMSVEHLSEGAARKNVARLQRGPGRGGVNDDRVHTLGATG